MPQVVTDPGFSTGIITNGGEDLFSFPNAQQPSVLALQAPASQPLPAGTATATNLLNPDLQIAAQLKNFPPNVYDLTPSSVLMHFMQALLGNAGTGQLRRRQMIARLQQAITSTHFYDLDSFYGALFGAQRGPSGSLPVNPATGLPVSPYTDLASADGWDEIEAIDATFRERIIALAKAITLGATVPGLQALAEAVSGVPCQVYEVWRLLDNALGPTPGYNTWGNVMADFPHWSNIPATETWQQMQGTVSYSGMGISAPNEIVIQPRKHYTSSVTDQQQKGSDQFGILSVVEVLKPAASLVTVDVNGPGIVTEVPIAAAWADSDYWEIDHLVTPLSQSDPAYAAALSAYQAGGAAPGTTFPVPRPPLSRSQGSQYSYAADVTTVTAQASTGPDPNTPVITDGQDFQTVLFPVPDADKDRIIGRDIIQYLPSQAVLPPQRAATARTSSPVAVKCAPWSGPRVPVKRSS
jgi:hypothetical protein